MRYFLATIAAFLFLTGIAHADVCSISSTGIAFTYDTAQSTPTDITGTVTTTCDNGNTHQVTFSTGGSGTYTNRVMSAAGGGTLNYQIYANGAHTLVYGDTTSGTIAKNAVGSTTFNLYGRIPARQNAAPGSYSDSVVTTISF